MTETGKDHLGHDKIKSWRNDYVFTWQRQSLGVGCQATNRPM